MTATDLRATAGQGYRLGVYYCLAGIFLFQLLNLLGKHLAESYPIVLLVFFRSLFALATSSVMLAGAGGTAALKTRHPFLVLLRALIWVSMVVCSFASFHLLPVPDAATIGFSAPIFVAALAGPLLRETVGFRCWVAVVIGFLGVLLIVRPSPEFLRLGVIFAVGDALFYALGSLLVRRLSRSEQSVTIVFYCCLAATLVSALALPFFWVAPAPADLLLLSLLGVLGAVAQYLATQAFRYAPASVVAPATYSGLVWALLFGYLIWGELPDPVGFLGAGLIVLAGIYVLRQESPITGFSRLSRGRRSVGFRPPAQ